jgi:peptidyl-prolyl cis-trans isomerase SurA
MPAEVDAALEQLRPGQLSQADPGQGRRLHHLSARQARRREAAIWSTSSRSPCPLAADADRPMSTPPHQAAGRSLKPKITSCDDLEATAGKVDGVVAGDLGEAEITDLAPPSRKPPTS